MHFKHDVIKVDNYVVLMSMILCVFTMCMLSIIIQEVLVSYKFYMYIIAET